MWHGESEKNVQKLFAPADANPDEFFVLIIDEIDALLPSRDHCEGSPAQASTVNAFLGELDGLKQRNNILVIGITNRPEGLDEAAKRPGRLGVHVEIGIPDEEGRKEIFEIYTKKLVEQGRLHKNVDIEHFVKETKKWTGADIESLINRAGYYALGRLNELTELSEDELTVHPSGQITQTDLNDAFEEIKKSKEKGVPFYLREAPEGMYG